MLDITAQKQTGMMSATLQTEEKENEKTPLCVDPIFSSISGMSQTKLLVIVTNSRLVEKAKGFGFLVNRLLARRNNKARNLHPYFLDRMISAHAIDNPQFLCHCQTTQKSHSTNSIRDDTVLSRYT